MHRRYQDQRITYIWSDSQKFELWQKVELAFLDAQISEGDLSTETVLEMEEALLSAPIDIDKIDKFESELKHDLNAFIKERRLHLPIEQQRLLHRGNTSYDTEEPAFAITLDRSCTVVAEELSKLQQAVLNLSDTHRYTVMIGRTHGQEAELQSFGKRCRGWLADLNTHIPHLRQCRKDIGYSKFSGAIGNFTTITPNQEALTLQSLGLKPFGGATQIMPRELYSPLADTLARICMTINKIALSIRLSSRSGLPLCQEPFGKGQMGSSAMPQKKNPNIDEQLEGVSRMAQGYSQMIQDNITTWEERAIEQSCVERVAWPDLFHVTVHGLKRLTYVISNLVVFPENMMLEVKQSGGLYASNEAKELLKELGEPSGLEAEEAALIIQLAAFNVAEKKKSMIGYRFPESLEDADRELQKIRVPAFDTIPNFTEIVLFGDLRVSSQLKADQETVKRWNDVLDEVFKTGSDNILRWEQIFKPSYLLRNESHYYQSVGIEPL